MAAAKKSKPQHIPFNLEKTMFLTSAETKDTTANDVKWYTDLKKLHTCAARAHCVLWILCVFIIIFSYTKGRPYAGTVKCFNDWPVWKSQKDDESYLPIVPKWTYCNNTGNLTKSERRQCNEGSESCGSIPLVWFLGILQSCTFAGHVIQRKLCKHKEFISLSEKGIKIIFWIEYTFSGSLIAFVAAYFGGTIDIKALLMVASSQSSLMLLGLLIDLLRYMNERERRRKEKKPKKSENEAKNENNLVEELNLVLGRIYCQWLPMFLIFFVGFANVLIIWTPGLVQLIKKVGSLKGSKIGRILALYITEIILYNSFGVVQLIFTYDCIWKSWKFEDKMRLEHNIHSLLSFLSKAVLVFVFALFFLIDH
tara:strand:- start:3110 stop:4210 length:1101 start_codon:yes stop_codon:yes gene_type:complete